MIVLDRLISSVQKIGNTVMGFTIEINHINDRQHLYVYSITTSRIFKVTLLLSQMLMVRFLLSTHTMRGVTY